MTKGTVKSRDRACRELAERQRSPGLRRFAIIVLFVTVAVSALLVEGCGKIKGVMYGGPKFTTQYQAVFLDNGQVFFGVFENPNAPYPSLTDVYYVRRVAQETEKGKQEVKNELVKRGSEWHGPDIMYLNAQHIVLVEPVSPSSRVAMLILEAQAR